VLLPHRTTHWHTGIGPSDRPNSSCHRLAARTRFRTARRGPTSEFVPPPPATGLTPRNWWRRSSERRGARTFFRRPTAWRGLRIGYGLGPRSWPDACGACSIAVRARASKTPPLAVSASPYSRGIPKLCQRILPSAPATPLLGGGGDGCARWQIYSIGTGPRRTFFLLRAGLALPTGETSCYDAGTERSPLRRRRRLGSPSAGTTNPASPE